MEVDPAYVEYMKDVANVDVTVADPDAMAKGQAIAKFDEEHPYHRSFLAPDLWIPAYANIAVRDEPGIDVDLDIKVSYDPFVGRSVADSIHFVRRAAGGGVNTVAIRAVPIQEYLRALRGNVYYGVLPEAKLMPGALPGGFVAQIREDGPSAESLRWVARIYTVAEVFNQPPGQAVREQLGMPTPTASVWIRRARDRGILYRWPTEPIECYGPHVLMTDRYRLGGWQWEA